MTGSAVVPASVVAMRGALGIGGVSHNHGFREAFQIVPLRGVGP